jgi:hypothetical protein
VKDYIPIIDLIIFLSSKDNIFCTTEDKKHLKLIQIESEIGVCGRYFMTHVVSYLRG